MYPVPGLPGLHSKNMSQENKTNKQIKYLLPSVWGDGPEGEGTCMLAGAQTPHKSHLYSGHAPRGQKEGHRSLPFHTYTEEETPSQTRRESEEWHLEAVLLISAVAHGHTHKNKNSFKNSLPK